jgi:hypothetical protein
VRYVIPYQYGITLLFKTHNTNNIVAWHWTCKVKNSIHKYRWEKAGYIYDTWQRNALRPVATETEILWYPTLKSTYCKMCMARVQERIKRPVTAKVHISFIADNYFGNFFNRNFVYKYNFASSVFLLLLGWVTLSKSWYLRPPPTHPQCKYQWHVLTPFSVISEYLKNIFLDILQI